MHNANSNNRFIDYIANFFLRSGITRATTHSTSTYKESSDRLGKDYSFVICNGKEKDCAERT
jgi:hypothetical protein